MKRPALILTVIAGLAVFLVVVVLYMPASWFASWLPPQARCNELGGSLWQGECLGLKVEGAPLGDATWNLAPGSALRGKVSGDVDIRGGALVGRADIDTSFAGVGELRNVQLELNMDPALLPQLPRDQRGRLNANLKRLELAAGPTVRGLEGTIEVHDLQQVGANPLQLGSYQANFDGKVQPDGTLEGKLRDLGGPFIVEGTITLAPPNNYLVQGYITGRTADAERLVREITLGAPPEASGRSPFSLEGTY